MTYVPAYVYVFGTTQDPRVSGVEVYLRRIDAEGRLDEVGHGSVWRVYLATPQVQPVLLRSTYLGAAAEAEFRDLASLSAGGRGPWRSDEPPAVERGTS